MSSITSEANTASLMFQLTSCVHRTHRYYSFNVLVLVRRLVTYVAVPHSVVVYCSMAVLVTLVDCTRINIGLWTVRLHGGSRNGGVGGHTILIITQQCLNRKDPGHKAVGELAVGEPSIHLKITGSLIG